MLPTNRPLEVLAPEVLGEMRQTYSEVVGAIEGPIETARELADRLGLERTLGWKIWRTVHGQGRYPSSKHIPGRPSIEAFLTAAADERVPPDLIDRARVAFGRYERLIREHAGDRAMLDSMLSGMAGDARNQSQERSIRRAGFRASSHAFGIHAKAAFDAKFVFPGEGDLLDLAAVRGYFGIQRVRTDSPWLLQRTRFMEDESDPSPTERAFRHRSLGEEAGPGGLPMPIRAFSSAQLPDVEWVNIETADYDCILKPGPIGKANAFDWVTGEHISGVEREVGKFNSVSLNLYTPSERVCMDFFIHESLWDGRLPEFRALCGLFGTTKTITNPYRIPVPEVVVDLGPADRSPGAPEVPRHSELVRFVFDKLGQDRACFRLFRVQMQYPPVPITLALLHMINA